MSLEERSDPRDGCERRGSLTGLLTSVELLRRTQDGQEQAFDQRIERYLPPLRRLAEGMARAAKPTVARVE